MKINQDLALILKVCNISIKAGKKILEYYYSNNNEIFIKDDETPLTKADLASNKIIIEELKGIDNNIPLLSEETLVDWNKRKEWNTYWLIDPLDGTKEFIKKNDEFTVNIALIENNKPTFGVIYAPILRETFWGSEGDGSFFLDKENNTKKINVSKNVNDPIKIVTSRSHPSDELSRLLGKIKNYDLLKVGSSLKFCLIASGQADIYPRLGPTSEWDTAAGEAILKFAGGGVIKLDGRQMKYNETGSLLNESFIALSDKKLAKKYFLSHYTSGH